MNKFEKVSFGQYLKAFTNDGKECISEQQVYNYEQEYNAIKLPVRSTANSAGYDFYAPEAFTLKPGEGIKVATGIKAHIIGNAFLALFPRSSLGFKYRLQLDNTVGIVDSDYYNNTGNEGHIFIKLTNNGSSDLTVNVGDAFAQGIFIPFLTTDDDAATGERVGGMGSTDTSK